MSVIRLLFKLPILSTCIFLSLFTIKSYADVFSDILGQLESQTSLQQQIQQYTSQLPQLQQQTINQLMNSSGANFGQENFNPNLQSWGSNLFNWNSVLTAYQNGGSQVAGLAQQLNNQFPIQQSSMANPNPQSVDAQYYTVQSQTALAARAASQYDYNNIQNQITYVQNLLSLIPQTKTVKDALDLQNRIQVESSLIQLEMLRLSSLSNQQQAIQVQGEVNSIVNSANEFK